MHTLGRLVSISLLLVLAMSSSAWFWRGAHVAVQGKEDACAETLRA